MISKIEVLVTKQQTELRVNNILVKESERTLIRHLKDLSQRYFTKFARHKLQINYILWTQAISIDELRSNSAIEADCLEVILDGELKDRQEIVNTNFGALLFSPIRKLAIEAQETQLLTGCFLTEKELGIADWKIKNTYFGNSGSLIEKNRPSIRSNAYFRKDQLVFASSPNSLDQIVFQQPLKRLGEWIADETKRYLMMITPQDDSRSNLIISLLDTEKMTKQHFIEPSFLNQVRIA